MKTRLLPFFVALLTLLPAGGADAQTNPLRTRTPPGRSGGPALAPLTPAQLAALAAERAKLIEGVKTLPRFGVPGPVAVYGASAFPIAVAVNPKAMEAVGAAGTMGKGRAVIFGHTGYLGGGESQEGDLNRLLLNSIRWCSPKKKPFVGLKGAKTASLLETHGIRSGSFPRFEAKTLRQFDVVIASVQDLTDADESAALKDFIEAGGGFIGALTGWAFGQTSGGLDFASAHRGNEALAGAGLAWTDDSLVEGPIEVPVEMPPLLHALTAPSAMAPSGGAPLPAPASIDQAVRTLELALSSLPAAARAPFEISLGGLLDRSAKLPVPTPQKPLTGTEERALAGIGARLLKFVPAADVKAHPAAASFPGQPGPQARPVARQVTIDPNVPGWHSTGLFAGAGAQIAVICPPERAGRGYSLRIGCHTDSLYRLDQWKRMPEITTLTPLLTAKTVAANPFGGLIYLVVPDKVKEIAPFEVAISGGVESPLFVLGKTSDAEWRQMRQRPAPWAELACKGVILTVPTVVARDIPDPAKLMTFWQRVVDAQDDLSNVASQRRRPERIVPDVQISAGYMHSGYPVMVHLPQAREMVTLNAREWPGWGFYHELGHNHQKPEWTFDGTGEVTCNLFSLYVFEAALGQDKTTGHGQVLPEKQREHWETHQKAGAPFAAWKSDPFLALTTYIQLIDAFGFDTLKQVFRSYQSDEFGPLPKSDDEKRDQWMIRYAKICGKNLGPFFDAWGIPVSDRAKEQIADLPPWMPEEMLARKG